MKFNKKLTNRSEAKQFIKDLVSNDLDFHFDTSAVEIFKGRLSELEIEDLQNRINTASARVMTTLEELSNPNQFDEKPADS